MVSTKVIGKIIDLCVFSLLIYLASQYYTHDPLAFELINTLSMLYVAIRKPDINTVTLISVLVVWHFTALVLTFSDVVSVISSYQTHGTLIVFNAFLAMFIALRPVFIEKLGPKFIANNKNLKLTHQDMIMTGLLTLQMVWQICQFLEHLARHTEDIGLDGLFGDWSPMLFYDTYKTGQFGFSILMLIVLYFMTFDQSKTKPKPKARLIV
ncbi:MAG: hypothetical protein ACI8WB_002334 [Phenylobacterium sp.]|jgi:hypothetical protein